MMGKFYQSTDGTEKFGQQTLKSRNAGLYKRLPGKTKIKSINELEYIKGKICKCVQKMQLQ
jgi:hypothetical protein